MRVLPVIDLKQGVVVRGIAGNRESYRPVVSQLVKSADPTAVATAFASKLAAADVYVADLDALGGAEPDWDNYRRIAAAGLKIWLDCGIRNVARARSVADFARQEKCLAGIIFALESVAGPADLRELVSFADPNLAIFSLDLLRGEPWSKSPGWNRAPYCKLPARPLRRASGESSSWTWRRSALVRGRASPHYAGNCVRPFRTWS